MKNIIKTAICLIVINSILLYSSVSNAAESDITITALNSGYAVAIESSMGNTDNMQSTTTFSFTTNIRCQVHPQDGYYTGHYRFSIKYDPSINLGNGWTLHGIQCFADLISAPDNTYRVGILGQPTDGQMNITVYFYNFPCFNATNIIDLGTITWLYSYYTTNSPNVGSMPDRILVSKTYSYILDYKSFSAIPVTGQGYALIYKQIITDALAAGNLDDVYNYLVQWKTTQDGYLADIELSVDDVEMWLSYINSAQATLQNKIDLIYVLEQTFPGYFNSMISLLQQIRDMNASDTAAESQMQNAEQQLSQAVNDMEVQKPNINNVVNAGDQYMDSNITEAQSDTFFYLHGSNILVTVLVMSVTIGILGFVIYGKSG